MHNRREMTIYEIQKQVEKAGYKRTLEALRKQIRRVLKEKHYSTRRDGHFTIYNMSEKGIKKLIKYNKKKKYYKDRI